MRAHLVVVGSLHPANDAQVAALILTGTPVVRLRATDEEAADRCVTDVASAFAEHRTVCLLAPLRDTPVDPEWIADALGIVVQRSATCFDGLVATGGDTTRRIVDALDVNSLDLAGEIEPEIPCGVLNSSAPERAFATKAGGFRDADTLLRCVERLRHPVEQRP